MDGESGEKMKTTKGLVVCGHRKEINPVEEFWMEKLTRVEKQYDAHVTRIERSLLNTHVQSRALVVKDDAINQLSKDVLLKNSLLQSNEQKRKIMEKSLQSQLFSNTQLKGALDKKAADEDTQRRRAEKERRFGLEKEKEVRKLKVKLAGLERERRWLSHDVAVKDNERRRAEEEKEEAERDKITLRNTLLEVDTERRVQSGINIDLARRVDFLGEMEKTQEAVLLQLRNELTNIITNMKHLQDENKDSKWKHDISDKHLLDTKETLDISRQRMEELGRQVFHWREELDFRVSEGNKNSLTLETIKRENVRLRSAIAELNQKLLGVQSENRNLTTLQKRLEVELEKTCAQEKAIDGVIQRNLQERKRLLEKIPQNSIRSLEKADKGENEIVSYRKKIWHLEGMVRDLKRKLDEAKRKENGFLHKMEKLEGVKKQLFWTEKSMMTLERDQKNLEGFIASSAMKIPKKMPLSSLLTDPSLLDRITKQKVLQNRLALQSARVAEAKLTAEKLLQYNLKLQTEDQRWGFDKELKLAREERWTGDVERSGVFKLTSGPQFEAYLSRLDREIPLLKEQLASLEKKKDLMKLNTKKKAEKSSSPIDSDTTFDFSVKRSASFEKMLKEDDEEEIEEKDEDNGN